MNCRIIGACRKTLLAGVLVLCSFPFRVSAVAATAGAPEQPAAVGQKNARSAAPINVIFDTDIWGDIDDALALAMIHALHDRREIKLVAVTISTNDPWCASYVDLVNTFYGHAEVPIGIGGLTTDTIHQNVTRVHEEQPDLPWPITRYTQRVSERANQDGTLVYPRKHLGDKKAPDAVPLLRKVLAAQPDGSVVLILVGHSTNIAELMSTPPDSVSDSSGRELIRRKVKLLSVMAGNFREPRFESNLLVDVPAAQKVFADWPTPVVASGFEIGVSLPYPRASIAHDYGYVAHHPIADTYLTFCEELKPLAKWTCPHEHSTFDLTSVLYAARPDRGYFSLSKPGRITVLPDGSSRFEEAEGGRDRYLILKEEEKARAIEAMAMLASQPPK